MTTDSPTKRLQAVLLHEIPLTRAVGIEVRDWDGQRLTLAAPLEPNLNHKCTAFGGSLYTVAVLAGWGLIWMLLEERRVTGMQIVIQSSEVDYQAPVESELLACAERPAENSLERFFLALERHGRARIRLDVTLGPVTFMGRYVVVRETPALDRSSSHPRPTS